MSDHSQTKTSNRSMMAAGLGAIGASACCVGPLILISLGIGGSWIATLTELEPYRPLFLGITLVFLGLAFYSLYLKPRPCAPDESCAIPGVVRNQRIIFWIVSILLVALMTFPYYGTIFFE